MYGAMREHAPASTRLTGVTAAATFTVAMALALANGLGGYVASVLPDPIIYVSIPDDATPPPTTHVEELTLTDVNALPIPKPLYQPTTFEIEDTRPTGATEPVDRRAPGPEIAATPAPPRAIRTAPRMLPMPAPPYPPGEARRNNQGTSTLEVCLNAGGRVTSTALANSSGHPALDQAALKWARDLKFTPAKVDGAPQAICGHTVVYEWRLDRR